MLIGFCVEWFGGGGGVGFEFVCVRVCEEKSKNRNGDEIVLVTFPSALCSL